MIRQLFATLGPAHGKDLRRMMVGMIAGAVLQGVAFAMLVPLLRALLGTDPSSAWPWLAVFAGTVVIGAAAHYAGQMAGFTAGAGIIRALEHRIGAHVVRLPLGWFNAGRVGELGQLTSRGVIDLAGIPVHLLRPVVNGFGVPATVVVAMLLFDWRIALAALASAPLLAATFSWSNRRIQRADASRHQIRSEANSRIVEYAQTQPVLRAFGRMVDGFHELDAALVAQRNATHSMMWIGIPGIVTFVAMIQAAFTAILLVGVYLAIGGSLDVPTLLAMLVLAARFVEPMIVAADLGATLKVAHNSLLRIRDVLAAPPLPEPVSPLVPTSADPDWSIELDDVSFGYDDRPVLSSVSLTVPSRTMTALVGPSGSGKTTVTRLVARFYDVDAGTVRVGGVDVRDQATDALMSQIALVFQDVYLFDGTILDNIHLGRPDATPEQVREAARLARVDEIVARLPDGWDSRVGESGTRLSGGERQRVSIARAILKDAPIVLLDEATAALDPENEAMVQDALTALTADRTLLVIAHRLQTIRDADQIAVLEHGRIVETGNHDDLLALGGRYTAFWTGRERAQGWRLAPSR